jgi:hypothetical protein
MNTYDIWARRWNVPAQALAELRQMMGTDIPLVPPSIDAADPPGSEARQQALVRIEAAKKGIHLFRNNSGAYTDDEGRLVRYGLANDSKQLNKVLKSSDLIGWRPRMITPEMVGTIIGQFTMREMKHEGWVFNPKDAHEVAQLAFLQLGLRDGCDASFATGPGTL